MGECYKNIDFVKTFRTAIEEVFSGSFMAEVKLKSIYTSDHITLDKINSSMDIKGDICGLAILTLEECLGAILYSRMTGCDAANVSDSDKQDCASEIINQITNRVRTILFEHNFRMNLALPRIMNEYSDLTSAEITSPIEAFDFECEGCNFELQLIVFNIANFPQGLKFHKNPAVKSSLTK